MEAQARRLQIKRGIVMRIPRRATFICLAALLLLFSARAGAELKVMRSSAPQPTVITSQGTKIPLYKGSYALLISESNYKGVANKGWPALPNTEPEVDKLAVALLNHGFTIWRVRDASSAELRDVLRNFVAEFGSGFENRLLFFFSGHGHTNSKTDVGYLVPVDAGSPEAAPIDFQRYAMPISELEQLSKEIEARHALFLFDSCFSGSIFTSKGLMKVDSAAINSEGRWRYFTGNAAKPVRQFISAGGPNELLPSRSVFLPLFIAALEGRGSTRDDGFITSREIGAYLEQTVPAFNKGQNPHSGTIRVPELSFGDMVFQYRIADRPAAIVPAPATSTAVAIASPDPKPPGVPAAQPTKNKLEVYFPQDKSITSEESTFRLEELVAKLQKEKLEVIIAVGYADPSEGTNAYAQKLAVRRAESVKAWFVSRGVQNSRVYTEGKVPSTGGASRAEVARNRRVEVETIESARFR
jgi:outer membrane protein OmpA-like peptidoglycan-associated protein